ncbi:hypothetical protein SAMN05192559_10110 [Halobacillus karajensis]|uniref:Uncharacterized protein n=1 Tax=Halobacillus karajensis TaxID=195088 RepID=A0A024P2Z0_9BACI|nr:hypothetical protein [Halobacillus karajensis]CDQ19337.1 hypothetical protein BN982_01626 [Halobacillus karajensis]CDQ22500.1 hypothetical protein BN983_00711 [Halobacillus karajensis]CDQ25982.1 hypothetical protein BN981_00191 [Halobacillus karajensis]SEH38165.1 hypothetical protein SAMN05192559_10110 [Halobacillus karajensis]
MRKATKWFLLTIGCVVGLVGLIIIIFIVEMTPSTGKEEEVKEKASAYLESQFSGQMEIYDTLYDNMGNFNGFEYAAKVTNTTNGVDFLVYEQKDTGEMVDTYAVSFFEEKLNNLIIDDIKTRFSEAEMIVSSYSGTDIDSEYVGEVALPNIQDLNVSPTISIWLNRGRKANDEKKINELIDILKSEVELPHASIKVEYQGGNENDGILIREY